MSEPASSSWERLRVWAARKLATTSPVLLVGIVVFALGFGMTLLRTPEQQDDGQVSLVQTVQRVFDTLSSHLPGELTSPEHRERVSMVLVALLSEALPASARARLDSALTAGRSLVSHMFGLPSLLTLMLVLGGYTLLVNRLEARQLRPPATTAGSDGA